MQLDGRLRHGVPKPFHLGEHVALAVALGLHAVRPQQRDARHRRALGQEGHRAPGHQRDDGQGAGEVGDQLGGAGQQPALAGVGHDGGQHPVEVHDQPGALRPLDQ